MTTRTPLLLIVSSPSGAGKTTLCRKLLVEFADLRFSISHTTRPPRTGERQDVDYHFVDQATFEATIEADGFIEWAPVHGNRYGTARSELTLAAAEGKDLLFDVDYQGARAIKSQHPEAVGVFVLPPSIEELRRRLVSRGTETEESLRRRFKAAIEEIRNHGLFDYLLVNDDLAVAYDRLRAVVLAERIRHLRLCALAEELIAASVTD